MSVSTETKEPVPPSESPSVAINLSTSTEGKTELNPLMYKWVMWCSKNQSPKNTKNQQEWQHKNITSFDTVEQFWSLMNFLEEKKNDILSHYVDVCFFRDGIVPDWDADENKDGGSILIFDPRCDNTEALFKYLIPLSCLMVGHQFGDAASNICGLFISRKLPAFSKGPGPDSVPWNISIWLNTHMVKKRHIVCDKICEALDLPPEVEVKWYLHAKKGKSFVNLRKKSSTSEEPEASASSSSTADDVPPSEGPSDESSKKEDTKSEAD